MAEQCAARFGGASGEDLIHCQGRVSSYAGYEVAVPVERDGDVRVSQQFLDYFRMEVSGGISVAQVCRRSWKRTFRSPAFFESLAKDLCLRFEGFTGVLVLEVNTRSWAS